MQSADPALAGAFDLEHLTDGFYDDPYPTYRALREHAPVKRMPNGSVFLTRHADLSAVYRDVRSFSSDKRREFGPKFGDTPLYEHHTTSLVFNDPPLHGRVRRRIAGALTPRVIAGLEAGLAALIDGLLDRLADKREADLIADFAAAIPVEVIGNLLAVPHADRGPLRGWSLDILGALEPVVPAAAMDAGNRSTAAFASYLEGLIRARTASPGDPERDLLTRLIADDAEGGRLTAPELVHNCIFLLNAGHETTSNLIGNALVALHDRPDQLSALVRDPGLTRTAVEEVLRFESSNQLGNRITAADAEIGGVRLPAGTPVTLCIGAANRDPAEFLDPDRMDVTRSPNRHLAFGAGPHQCAGMSLARLEGVAALSRFIARFPRFRLSGRPLRMRRARFRGFSSVPALVSPAG